VKKALFLFVLAMSLTFCSKTSDTTRSFENKEAKIRIYVCSRGCYQYLISIPATSGDTLFYPVNLSDDYKQISMDGVKIRLTADILSDMTQIYYPSPTDAPVPLFQVKNINIIKIENSK
jgi:hypothetical protein